MCSFHQRLVIHFSVYSLHGSIWILAEVCFYNGFNSYAKTWLQLVFPLYIWLTVGGIIVVRRYSVTISKITPNNRLQILATVSLLAYTKFLQVIITAFSYAILQYSDDLNKTARMMVM